MYIKIVCRFTGSLRFEGEFSTLKDAVIKAVIDKADLYGADLYGADLYGADLYGANLRGANLYDADLYGADLRGANLYGANLYDEKLIVSPIIISGLRWEILITAGYLKIGCERHTHIEWKAFKRDKIGLMDTGAWDWWKTYSATLLGLCDFNKAEAIKLEKEKAKEKKSNG